MKQIEKLADDWADKHITHGEMTTAILAYQEGFRKAREMAILATENFSDGCGCCSYEKAEDVLKDLGEAEDE